MISREYPHLGVFSDWVKMAKLQRPIFPTAPPGVETQRKVRDVLGFTNLPEEPRDVRVERKWEADGLVGEKVSWSVGYGPRTEAWVLKPLGAVSPLPGIVALHDHSLMKFYGKEKIAIGPDAVEPSLQPFWDLEYGGRPFANALAREGFVVLVHDTFSWGSRRFPESVIPPEIQETVTATRDLWMPWRSNRYGTDFNVSAYDEATVHHEHLIEKYCALLGTTYAGVVSYEDRVAVNYLASRPDVVEDKIGCVGLSGGGARAGLLQATSDRIKAAVVVSMMTTYEALLDHNVVSHTWILFPHGWSRYGDWPDLVACRAPSPLLVQYNRDDDLFTLKGMQEAHERLTKHYDESGHPDAYRGEFYSGHHKFDLSMQASAFAWLKEQMRRER